MGTTTAATILFCLFNAIDCIPRDELFAFANDDDVSESFTTASRGNNFFSAAIFPNVDNYVFYDEFVQSFHVSYSLISYWVASYDPVASLVFTD